MFKLLTFVFAFMMFLISQLALAQPRDRTLIIGMDISDSITFDPSRQAEITPPLTIGNVYETLVTATL